MDNKYWINHLGHWKKFLDECLARAESVGDRTKILRQKRVLEEVRLAAVLNPKLLLEFIQPNEEPKYSDERITYCLTLNESQKRAVSLSLGDNLLSFIQGPPGTGKTQVITEICLQLYKKNPNIRILICSEMHVAVNNLISRLSRHSDEIRIVRIKDKDQEPLDDFSPEYIIDQYISWLNGNLISSDLAELISETFADRQDKSLEKALALSANITGMTCNRVGAYTFDKTSEMFDVVIIDEVCKATLPEILGPLAVAKKAILVGDPKQLPPVFCSEEQNVIQSIDDCDLQEYIYIDQLFCTSKCVTLLDTQYRMAERIGTLVGTLFYSGKLINGRTTTDHGGLTWVDYMPTQPWPLVQEGERKSIYNLDECRIILALLNQLDYDKNKGCLVAIIAPYRGQVENLRNAVYSSKFQNICPRVDTVDGFQGKESDIVIFSLTRTCGSFRFLADNRRLNVALSRAKDHLYMIGSLEYAKTNKLLNEISKYCDISNTSYSV